MFSVFRKSGSHFYGDNYVMCKSHQTICSHVCLDCENIFICTYCCNREHKEHYVDSIKNQAETCRNLLKAEFDKIKEELPAINLSYKNEIQKLEEERKKLKLELEERSLHKVRELISMLSKEKEKVLKTFDDHISQSQQFTITYFSE